MFENEKDVTDQIKETEEGKVKGMTMVSGEGMEAEIKAKYPKVYRVDAEIDDIEKEFIFYFKKPTPASFNIVIKNMSKRSLAAMKLFTLESIVSEQKQEYEEVIEEYPALAMSVGQKLLGLLGLSDNISLKKL